MKETLPENIIKTIEEHNLAPIPRWHFLLKRSVFWSIAGASVVLGGIAIAVIIFVFFDHDPDARNYLNQSFVDDILLTIPYLWLATLVFLIALARISIRRTKGGYRYGILKVAGFALAVSLALGLVLNAFDFGDSVNEYLNESIPYYNSLVYTSKDAWSQPQKGLLGGTVVSVFDENTILIQDFRHKEWKIDLSERQNSDTPVPLQPGDSIRITGKDTGSNTFQVEQIFPWQN